MDLNQLEPTIEQISEENMIKINRCIDELNEINGSNEDEPKLNEDDENKFVLNIFDTTEATPNWENTYKEEQKKIKRQDREKFNYESESTSEDAMIDNFGNMEIKIKEEPKYCQFSPHNNLWHILYGKKGVINMSAVIRGVGFNPLVVEYFVRVVLIRANIQHRQYPVECVCLQHRGPTDEDTHQVLQAKPGTSPDKFWYTFDGLRKSIIFEAPRPDQDGNIHVQMNLVSLCCDSCEAASPRYQKLIDNAGKEAGRDWLLVTTLEAKNMSEKQVVLARHVAPCWFKAAVNPRDLAKPVRRKEKGGGAQKASRLRKIRENSLAVDEPDGKKLCQRSSGLDSYLISPPEGKRLLPKPSNITVGHYLLPRPVDERLLLRGNTGSHDDIQVSPPIVKIDWSFHAEILGQHLRNGDVTLKEVLEKMGYATVL